jgi:ferredoxin
VKVIVDNSKCQGHGRCYDLSPEVFDADEDGYVLLNIEGDIPADLEQKARTAVLNCPENALSLSE